MFQARGHSGRCAELLRRRSSGSRYRGGRSGSCRRIPERESDERFLMSSEMPSGHSMSRERFMAALRSVAMLAFLALSVTGCQRSDRSKEETVRGPSSEQAFATAGAPSQAQTSSSALGATSASASSALASMAARDLPSDMCAQHGLLKAVCTGCNPKLAVVFQTKGDWCAEHQVPESFCPICHPERGGRPAVEVARDDAPADGLPIRLESERIADRVGLETVPAMPSERGIEVLATATLVVDNARSAVVSARASALIREFLVDLGDHVRKGAPLAILESNEVAHLRGELLAAQADEQVAVSAHERELALRDQGISAAKTMQEAERDLTEARARVQAARSSLAMLGALDGEAGRFQLLAPVSGIVTARRHSVGTLVGPEEPVFEIVDTSVLWAEIDIPETQAMRIQVGQRVELEVAGLDEPVAGAIDYLSPVIDRHTRTVRARATLDNRLGLLRANTYARARIFASSGLSGVVVPREAIQEAEGVLLAFVSISDTEFVTRRVRAIPTDLDWIVTSGLEPGERVVTTGSFLLKTETLKGSIGAGCCDPGAPK